MRANHCQVCSCFGILALSCCSAIHGQAPDVVQNASGLRLLVENENTQPSLAIILPDHPDTDRTINVLFPEHVTARQHGSTNAQHLYLFRPGSQGQAPAWRKTPNSLEYEQDFAEDIHMFARATLEDDGVLFQYEFVNRSKVAYDMVYAVTDPRLTGIFHDVRLERTYVHHEEGFDLLASETPARLTVPLDRWLPCRYFASFTWPVPKQRTEKRDDGITYYNKSRAVDVPLIATRSTDLKWVVASFTNTTGNVWSNPELTCQHVDPQAPLPAGGQAKLAVKMLVFRGSLEDVMQKVKVQRSIFR